MTRKTHLVGSWPGRTPEHAMEAALKQLSPHLLRMTDGETGDRASWITVGIDALRANPDVEMINDGDWSSYHNVAKWRVKEGHTLDPDNIRLCYARYFDGSFPAFKELRARFGRPDLQFQVGIPASIDVAGASFGEAAFTDPSIPAAFTTAAAREIEKIRASADEEVLFQLETVFSLVAVAREPDEAQPEIARRMAAGLAAMAAAAPEGTHFGCHLCLGDFNREAFTNMRDARPLVLVANAIVDQWPEGRVLDYIHVPFAAARKPPIEDEAFYEPLSDLRLPEDVRFVAGFLHETLDLPAHQQLLARIESRVGRPVDVAAACGLGRRDTPEEALEEMREAAALIETA